MNKKLQQSGFSLIEVILAAALFVIFASGSVASVLQGFDLNRNGVENTVATQYATEGIEAMKSIKNQIFSNLTNTNGTGIIRNINGVWVYNGVNNSFNQYTRVISVADVQRDINGNIVTSGGTVDTSSKKITSTVNWNFTSVRPQVLNLVTYLSDWRGALIGNWANPSRQSSLDLASNGNGIKVAVQGNYAYVVRTIGSPNFIIVNITNLATPTVAGSLNFGNVPTNIFVSGNYAYLSSRDNAGELQIVNITNPASPSIAGVFNAAGNADANAVFVVGTTAYLARDTSGSPNFYVVNITNPTSPTSLGSISLTGNLEDIFISGTVAYIATSDDAGELKIVNITNPGSMSLLGTLNLTGNNDALTLNGFSNTILLGRVGGDLVSVNVTNPASPALINTLIVGGDINDLDIENTHQYLFLVTSNGTTAFQAINISNLSAMSVLGSLNMSTAQNGIVYDNTTDRVFIVGSTNNSEFAIIQPN